MRGSVVITGPLLARFGNVSFPAPGGCVIGARPIDLFIEGYKKMGATVEIKDAESNLARYEISAPEGGLRGAEIIFPIQTVGGTETLMMTAVLARGKTLLKNCALEPEIISLAEFLNVSGADIRGIGTPTLEIHGKGSAKTAHLLRQKPNTPYVTIPDRIEAGSFLFLAALSARDLKITHCDPSHLDVPLSILRDAGVLLEIGKNYIRITSQMILDKNQNPLDLKPSHIRTHEYPGFPTDIQAPAAVFLTQTIGESIIFETIFEGRFKYVDELNRMGASITTMNPREIVIKGKTVLRALDPGESLVAHDIRAGFAVIMAALLAEGTSVIRGTYLIDRGYERIEERLRAIGAHIQRIQN
jgi:UDP-N-acetylglucosamine 1-carboxyvinyltransferase